MLSGKDGSEIDFMCLYMIDPASSWFEIVELLVITEAIIPLNTKEHKAKGLINNLSRHTLTHQLQ